MNTMNSNSIHFQKPAQETCMITNYNAISNDKIFLLMEDFACNKKKVNSFP